MDWSSDESFPKELQQCLIQLLLAWREFVVVLSSNRVSTGSGQLKLFLEISKLLYVILLEMPIKELPGIVFCGLCLGF